MKYYGEIDFLKKPITIEKKIKKILIDKFKYKTIIIGIPFYTDWTILQNDYLPIIGAYFLN